MNLASEDSQQLSTRLRHFYRYSASFIILKCVLVGILNFAEIFLYLCGVFLFSFPILIISEI